MMKMHGQTIPQTLKQPSLIIVKLRIKTLLDYIMYSFGCFPGVWLLYADVSEPSIGSIFIQPLKMEPIEGSETSANYNRTPGK